MINLKNTLCRETCLLFLFIIFFNFTFLLSFRFSGLQLTVTKSVLPRDERQSHPPELIGAKRCTVECSHLLENHSGLRSLLLLDQLSFLTAKAVWTSSRERICFYFLSQTPTHCIVYVKHFWEKLNIFNLICILAVFEKI